MSGDSHVALAAGYAAALAGWLAAQRALPAVWPGRDPFSFAHPWLEVLWALLAGGAVIGVGQIYQRGWLLPTTGALGPVLESVNQVIIFLPLAVLLAIRRQSLATAWLPAGRLGARLGAGIALALSAVVAFTLVRSGSDPFWKVVPRVFRPTNVPIAVQVFLEDVAIAILLVRIGAATEKPRVAAVVVAALFAASHLPAMFGGGAVGWEDLASLSLDFVLAAGVLLVVQRSADVVWFWCVHCAMDLMQFSSITGAH
ncbi:MAG: hypothetical protein HYR85_06605 [Planctomycetes bacterium]|nr:hypothetical protein [Planctomycetota bacterium]